MKIIKIDSLAFSFEVGWSVEKYDSWNFYRKHFQKARPSVKAVDILAISPENWLFLMEVKDYRRYPRTKPSEISAEFSGKVFDTLAALLPANLNASDADEKDFASKALSSVKIRIVLHIEQPAKHSKLFPRAIDLSNVKLQLRQSLKAIDPHPWVTDGSSKKVPWTVTNSPDLL